ncbi:MULTISPECIES: hypothetical protein [Ruminococcus]|uniref:Uncharacterized protein n=1 Tax=Ruminococcus flavefaciens TaxID=1265 RepID=A0A1M7JK17_RUMFL|nr:MULTISPECIES: hypothetical protein [Ruminococcus]MCR4794563.1 hypothetical protein [Ruminococcus sp.]SHM53275.1 hypothetical protein SAMN04487860_10651 [Ruminococcus flavefaciens]
MAFVPPVPLIRKKRIVRALMKANAYSEGSARRLDEIGLFNPYGFPLLTARMIKRKVISVTDDGRYYLNKG